MARGHRQGLWRGGVAEADDCASRLAKAEPEERGAVLMRLIADDESGALFDSLRGSDALAALLPEVAACDGFDQRSPWHPEGDLYVHLSSVYRRMCALTDDPDMRLAAILHDVGKPASFWLDDDGVGHFYASPEHGTEAHEVIGERMARDVVQRLGIGGSRAERITRVVRWHMSRPTTDRGLRRLRSRVGDAILSDLLLFRLADHEGADDPAPYVARMHALHLEHQRESQ